MLKKFLEKIKQSIWFVPAVFSIIGIALAIFVLLLDNKTLGDLQEALPQHLFTDYDLAKEILNTIAVSLLTMITFTFSTMMIVLTMYSSQFSPRILPNFLTNRRSTTVLGVFMGTFIYSILSLFFLRQRIEGELLISPTIAIMLVVLCLGFFTFFIYHVAVSIQVENLVDQLYKAAEETIGDYKRGFKTISSSSSKENYVHEIVAHKNGYVQFIDYESISKIARDLDSPIYVAVEPGKFVLEGENLALLQKEAKDRDKIREVFSIGNERTTVQDIQYSLQKLADIALRAISPGINDPNTARECITNIGLVLGEISDSTGKVGVEEDGKLLLHMDGIDFKEVLYFTFYQIMHYGKEDVSIVFSSIEALTIVALKAPKETRELIWDFHKYIVESVDLENLKELDKSHMERLVDKLERAVKVQS